MESEEVVPPMEVVEFEAGYPPTLVHSGMSDAMDSCLARIECGFVRGFAAMQLIGKSR